MFFRLLIFVTIIAINGLCFSQTKEKKQMIHDKLSNFYKTKFINGSIENDTRVSKLSIIPVKKFDYCSKDYKLSDNFYFIISKNKVFTFDEEEKIRMLMNNVFTSKLFLLHKSETDFFIGYLFDNKFDKNDFFIVSDKNL